MKLSIDRILTTHVGSLPRPQALVELLVKKDHNEAYDHTAFEREVTKAVAEIVAHQVAVGIDVVSDGEASKVGYATYIKERLTGFGGEPYTPKAQRDLADYPEFRNRMVQFTGPQVFQRLCCIGRHQDKRPWGREDRHRQLQGGDRRVASGGRVHAGGVAWRGVGIPAEPALSKSRRLYRCRRRSDA